MSTRIIDELKAIKIPQEIHGETYRQDIYILCELGGDNNLINTRTNRRARHWTAVAIGETWRVIGEICEYAGSFEGGMTKFSTGRATPESYIRRCRKALADADTFGSGELRLTFPIRFNAQEKENGAKYQYEELIKAGATPQVETRYGEKGEVFHFSSTELKTWLKGIHGCAWRNVEVSGPREV